MTQKRKIVIIISLFVAIHALFCLGFHVLSNRKNELVLRFSKYKQMKDVNILFMGDSHVERGIDVKQIDNAYSLAYYGENSTMYYYRLKYCIDHHFPKPNYIVLSCDLPTFSQGFNSYRTNKFFYYSFIPFSELKNFEQNQWDALYNFVKVKVFPYAEWQYGLNIHNVNRQAKGKNMFSDLPEVDRKKNAKNLIQNEMNCAADKSNLFSPIALSYLSKTLELCKKENIKLIFVKFPLTEELFDQVRLHVDSNYIDHRPSEEIISKYKIPVLDFEYDFLNKEYLFFDCHHLNDSGKVMFMPKFKVKLDSLLKIY